MTAACPHCFDNALKQSVGCGQCHFTGTVTARFAEGIVYHLWCRAGKHWGFGFHIDRGDDLPPNVQEEEIVCSECGSDQMEWKPAGYTDGGGSDASAPFPETPA